MLSISRDGKLLIEHDGAAVTLRSPDGGAHTLEGGRLLGAAAFADQVWLLEESGAIVLGRVTAAAVRFGERLRLPELGGEPALAPAPFGPPCAILRGRRVVQVREDCGRLEVTPVAVPEGAFAAPISAGSWFAVARGALHLRRNGAEQSWSLASLGVRGEVVDGAAILGGQALALLTRHDELVVIDARSGSLLHKLRSENVTAMRVAHQRGRALLLLGMQTLVQVDLRLGSVLSTWDAGAPVVDFDVDGTGECAAIQQAGEGGLRTLWAPIEAARAVPPPEPTPPREAPPAPRPPPPRAREVEAPIDFDGVELRALRPRLPTAAPPEEEALASVEQRLDLVGAWCKRALAEAWDSGRISFGDREALPFEREAEALLDRGRGRAQAALMQARQRVVALEAAPWLSGPFEELAREVGLSELALRILLVVAAPLLRGELARSYGIIASDAARPLCDELLVAQILGAGPAGRRAIAAELEHDAPLVRSGAVQVSGVRPFAALTISSIVRRRLSGLPDGRDGDEVVARRRGDRKLSELLIPAQILRRLTGALAEEPCAPLRFAVAGRTGAGRTTLLAALAAQANRDLGVIDLARLPGPEALRVELQRAGLRGWLPCLTQAEHLAPEKLEPLRAILREHDGPVCFRCPAGEAQDLSPGALRVELPVPSEEERAAFWRRRLDEAGLPTQPADLLAASSRVGPGTVTRAVRAAARQQPQGLDATLDAITGELAQQRETRIGSVATRVTRLASWSNVVLPPEVCDSVREFVGRVQHRRTVFERWGYDRVVTSARGLTALFSGGPGTGKSMVAGIIARELGYDLYRVDLSRVLSKWVGETEKNLATVFDAAEDGDVILLFDEADSLFARRTSDVRNAADRYANVEVNYLLQRLDSFEGIAILTTNAAGALDPAFKRRLSFRLTFPFPDEEMRADLWRVHLPPELPREGELDLESLAKKYQLSGGYIRNAAVRAAFLAAREDRPLMQEHLERAVVLEYREVGKLTESGVLE